MAIGKPYYYVSGVVVVTASPAYFQIMEEKDGKQVCIATVPFNKFINPKYGREPAQKDAQMIVEALNKVHGEPSTQGE